MKHILHLDDQPGSVDWMPVAVFGRLVPTPDREHTIKRIDNRQWAVSGPTVNFSYVIVTDLSAFITSVGEKMPDCSVLDYQVNGTGLNVEKIISSGINLESTFIWTAYPDEAARAFQARTVEIVQKGAREQVLGVFERVLRRGAVQ